jgi:hypothetical protein
MPLPTPRKGKNPESKKDFISRCAGDPVMNKEYKDQSQKLGICYNLWERSKKKAKESKAGLIVGAGDNEFIFNDEAEEQNNNIK